MIELAIMLAACGFPYRSGPGRYRKVRTQYDAKRLPALRARKKAQRQNVKRNRNHH